MAMSARCFVFVLCLIIGIIIGAVVFVVIQMKQKNQGDETGEQDESTLLADNNELDPKKAATMCESIVNGTEPSFGAYNHPVMFRASMGVNSLGIRVVHHIGTGDTYQKNSYWLIGDGYEDKEVIAAIRVEACKGKIPVIVIKMRPNKGLSLSRNIQVWNHYKPNSIIPSWEEYDKRLKSYLKYLAPIPAIVILEPDLLMFTYDTQNLQYGWVNDKYRDEFLTRAQHVIRVMAKAWVYVDAGNAAYLRVRENIEKMAQALLRLDGLRGFSINTAHFYNTSYNNVMARRLHCLTGLHYITDTSRNGGPFSRQSTNGIEKCFYDPPNVLRGLPPGWSWGIKLTPRQKRWVANFATKTPTPQQQTHRQTSPPTSRTQSQTSRRPIPTSNHNVRVTQRLAAPPNPQEDPEAYNKYINSMRNGNNNNNNPHHNNIQPNHGSNNHQPNNVRNNPYDLESFDDLRPPSGRVPINSNISPTVPVKKAMPTRIVAIRSKQEALHIYRNLGMRRGLCMRKEPVTVHDANVWIKAPGEADGRLYAYGTYHKCLMGHTRTCGEECRLILDSDYEDRSNCRCDKTNPVQTDVTNNIIIAPNGIFFPADDDSTSEATNSRNTNVNAQQSNQQQSRDNDLLNSYSSLTDILSGAG